MFANLDPAVQAALITAIATSITSILGSTIWGIVMVVAARKNRQVLYDVREEFNGKFDRLINEKQAMAAVAGLDAGLHMAEAQGQKRREGDEPK